MREPADCFIFHRAMTGADRRSIDGHAGEEEFVTKVKFAAVDGSLDNAQREFVKRESYHAPARDALESAGRSLCDAGVLVEEDGFVETRFLSIVAGQCAVHIGAADFGASRDRIVLDPTPGAYA